MSINQCVFQNGANNLLKRTNANGQMTSITSLTRWKLSSALTSAAYAAALGLGFTVYSPISGLSSALAACSGTTTITCTGASPGQQDLGSDVNLILTPNASTTVTTSAQDTVIIDDAGTNTVTIGNGATLQQTAIGGSASDTIFVDGAANLDLDIQSGGTLSNLFSTTTSSHGIAQNGAATGRLDISLESGALLSADGGTAVMINANRNDHSITNSGTIERSSNLNTSVILFNGAGGGSGGTVTNTSSGIIRSAGSNISNAIRVSIGPVIINNAGLIETTNGTTIRLSSGAHTDIIANSGIIRTIGGTKAVDMGSGNDTFSMETGGSVTGIVDGGTNTDMLSFVGTGSDNFNLSDIGAGQQYINFEIFDVAGGEWTFSGTTTQNFIQSGGTIKGNATFGSLTVNNGGTLAPGNSIGTINTGNLTLNSGSKLEIEVDENGNSDLVNVTGTVSLGSSTLDINGAAGTYAGAPYDYTIIINDGVDAVTGIFGTITDDLAFLEASVDYTGGDGNDVVLTLSEIASFAIAGSTQNAQNVGVALSDIDRTSGSEGEALMQQIVVLTNEQAKQTQKTLAGDIHPSNTHTMFDVGGNVGGQIGGRFANLTSGGIGAGNNGFGYRAALETLNSNSTNGSYFSTDLATQDDVIGNQEFGYGYTPISADEKLQFWGGISGYYANVEGDGNAQGTTSSGFGAVFGSDRAIGGQIWGAAFGYAKTTTVTNDGLSELGMNAFSGAIYTQQEVGDFNLNALAAYTYHQIDGKRTISNINATALSDYHAHQFTLQSEISRTFAYDHNKDITPYVLGRYMNLSTSAYTETGAGAANLISNGEDFWSLDLVFGARMDIEVSEDTKLSFGGGYSHRFGDNSPEARFAFSGGGNFTSTGVERNRHSAFLEAGFEKSFSDNAKFFASANASLTDTHQSIGGNIGIKVGF